MAEAKTEARVLPTIVHLYKAHPFAKDLCDFTVDDDGRRRTCAQPRALHFEEGQLAAEIGRLRKRVEVLEGEETAKQAAQKACLYILIRIQTDPDLRYFMGPLTESFSLLCRAQQAATGEPLERVMADRAQDLQPEHRKREPEVLVLRRKVEDLETGVGRQVQVAPAGGWSDAEQTLMHDLAGARALIDKLRGQLTDAKTDAEVAKAADDYLVAHVAHHQIATDSPERPDSAVRLGNAWVAFIRAIQARGENTITRTTPEA